MRQTCALAYDDNLTVVASSSQWSVADHLLLPLHQPRFRSQQPASTPEDGRGFRLLDSAPLQPGSRRRRKGSAYPRLQEADNPGRRIHLHRKPLQAAHP